MIYKDDCALRLLVVLFLRVGPCLCGSKLLQFVMESPSVISMFLMLPELPYSSFPNQTDRQAWHFYCSWIWCSLPEFWDCICHHLPSQERWAILPMVIFPTELLSVNLYFLYTTEPTIYDKFRGRKLCEQMYKCKKI